MIGATESATNRQLVAITLEERSTQAKRRKEEVEWKNERGIEQRSQQRRCFEGKTFRFERTPFERKRTRLMSTESRSFPSILPSFLPSFLHPWSCCATHAYSRWKSVSRNSGIRGGAKSQKSGEKLIYWRVGELSSTAPLLVRRRHRLDRHPLGVGKAREEKCWDAVRLAAIGRSSDE